MKEIRIAIFDNSKKTIEVFVVLNDDSITRNIALMKDSGMDVGCSSSFHIDSVIKEDYLDEDNLYSRLLMEYEQVTGKELQRF